MLNIPNDARLYGTEAAHIKKRVDQITKGISDLINKCNDLSDVKQRDWETMNNAYRSLQDRERKFDSDIRKILRALKGSNPWC